MDPRLITAAWALVPTQACHVAQPSTIGRRCAAIGYVHTLGKHRTSPSPTADERVKVVVRGIRRTHGAATKKATPATADRIITMAPRADGSITTLRYRALLLLGFAGALPHRLVGKPATRAKPLFRSVGRWCSVMKPNSLKEIGYELRSQSPPYSVQKVLIFRLPHVCR